MKTRVPILHLTYSLGLLAVGVFIILVSTAMAREPGVPALSGDGSAPDAPSKPPQLFSPYGTVQVNSENVEVGTLVGGWWGGIQWDTYPAELDPGTMWMWYALEIPGDDPATSEAVEGCASGDTVTFTIGGVRVLQSATWYQGAARVDLTTTFGVNVAKQISTDGLTWYEADTPSSYPELEEGAELTWRIAITNTSTITVSLTVTDTLDGSLLDLSTLCTPELPSTLPPEGEPGASYVCDISGSAIPGTHDNLVTVTVAYAALDAMAYDRAGYVGIKDETYIYLPLVLR